MIDMKRSIYKKSTWDLLRNAVFPILFSVAIICMIIFGLQQTEQSSRTEGLRILEDSIRRAVIVCYAVEGRYPDSLEHIENNYGIYIDRSKYTVYYSIFASNLLPEITVVELAPVLK